MRPPPARFSEVWQFSIDWPGTPGQQQAVRDAFAFPFHSNGHRLMQRLDRHVNDAGRSYLPIGFMDTDPRLAIAGAGGINLSHHLNDPIIIQRQVCHEVIHVVDQRDMITQEDRHLFMDWISGNHRGDWMKEYQETFADAGRDWLLSSWASPGQWFKLTRMLLPDREG